MSSCNKLKTKDCMFYFQEVSSRTKNYKEEMFLYLKISLINRKILVANRFRQLMYKNTKKLGKIQMNQMLNKL